MIYVYLATEYAGELRDFYPSTKVTIVHNGSMLLSDAYPEKYRRRVERDARARGVEIVLDDRIDDLTPSREGTVTTRKGRLLQGDLVVCLLPPFYYTLLRMLTRDRMGEQVPTFGCRPATSFLTSLEPNILNPNGQIKVNPYLQLVDPAFSNVFACGDAIDWAEQKQGVSPPTVQWTSALTSRNAALQCASTMPTLPL